MSQAAPAEERRLNSWKEIAAYFGNDQRTVKRWESTRGLPVRRLPGARSGVFALVSEIEAWQRGEPVSLRNVETAEPPNDFSPEAQAAIPLEEPLLREIAPEPLEEPAASQPAADAIRVEAPRPTFFWRAALTAALLLLIAGIALWQYRGTETIKPQAHIALPHARELYLQGRFLWNKRTPEALKAARSDFEESAKIDPQYAAAYAGIADCYALSPEFDPRPGSEVYPRMLAAAHKALTLDASLPDGHRALAFVLFYWNFDTKASRAEFEEALRLAPHDATTHLWFANTLATTGMHDQAMAEIERAREIDPASLFVAADRAWILYRSGRKEEAYQSWARLEQTDPDYTMVHTWLASLYLDEHKGNDFLRELGEISRLSGRPSDEERLNVARAGLRRGGEPGLRAALADFEADRYRRGAAGAYDTAVAMVRAGRREEAMDLLERSYRTRDQFPPGLAISDVFLPLHAMPRFQQLVAASEKPYPDEGISQAVLRRPLSTDAR